MSDFVFIKAGAALGVFVTASTAMAGDVERVDLNFAGFDYWSFDQGAIDPKSPNYNGQTVSSEAARNFSAVGCSNLDTTVCWNTGATYENWASELAFAMTMTDGTAEGAGWYLLFAPYAGDDTGPATEGTCDPRAAADEQRTEFLPFTYYVEDSGEVSVAMGSSYNDGTALAAGSVVNADFFFELGAPLNPACISATGACAEVHPEPGCNDPSCCSLVCDSSVGGDEFCCSSSWDSSCVQYAIALCGIFEYNCDNPGPQANDCATSPAMASNGVVYAFDTTGANTDGPDEVGCGSAESDLPVHSDLWYMIDASVDGFMTATCCLDANFDTKIAVYDAGASGSSFDPGNLPEAFLACNEDCDDPDFFSSELVVSVAAGNQYLVRLGGYQGATGTGNIRIDIDEPEPPIEPQSCDTPGDNPVTQSDTLDLTDGGIACAAGGITVENAYCRVYTKDELGGGDYSINCVNFGRANSGSYLPAVINLYVDPDGGDPGPGGDLILIGSSEFGAYTTTENQLDTVSFGDSPVCVSLADGETLVVEMEIGASLDGFVTFAGGNANTPGSFVWIRSGPCGIAEYITLESIGFTQQWAVEVSGSFGCSGAPACDGDFNDDGIVDGADFGTVLAAWGPCPSPCPQDLDGSGEVDGADLGLMLSYWGPCP
ncbi:MAG: hypothetical protein MK085_04855 [Phycisphaerales bacterium]|nr:hypothetical protein [Phycisphaerales bacterium]